MDKPDNSLGQGGREQPMSKAEFLNTVGISPELEELVNDLFQRPEMLNSLSQERRHEIEAQMEAVLSLFA